jgi:purine-binding chemotaxis protein CheW
MKAAPATPRSAPSEVLVFLLDREEYGVDILKVQEIRGYEKPTPIPSAPPYLKGVVNLRGTVVPIIDLRTKFGFADPRYDALTVTIILRLSDRIVGVVVDGVSDAVVLEQGDVKPPPDLGGLADAAFIEGIATKDGRMVMLFDIEKFLSGRDLDLLSRASRSGAPSTEAVAPT